MTKVDMHIPGKSDLDVSFDGSRKIHQEAPFERYISRKVAGLEHSGWALSPDDTGFDPTTSSPGSRPPRRRSSTRCAERRAPAGPTS